MTVLYAVACLMLPSLWALAMFYAFEHWERRRRPARSRAPGASASPRDDQDLPPIDYMI
jgi:hypothetical protein